MTETDAPGLAQLLTTGKFTFLALATALLSAPAHVAGWRQGAVEEAAALKGRGWRLALELTADEAGAATIRLIAIAPGGGRREMCRVSETARTTAH